ncbi:MAG: DUF1592 domain-containing protein [Synoicihabitans sp.]
MLVLGISRGDKSVVLGLVLGLLGNVLTAYESLNYGTLLSADPQGFIQEYCISCHGEEKQKGDRRFDHLELNFDNDDTAFDWQEVLDMVNLGEMPPEDEPQPSDEEVRSLVATITPKLDAYYARLAQKESTGLRRMNSFQYRNTLRDLLGLNLASFDPTSSFPSEDREHGFDNIASKLVTSRYLMERYLEAASTAVDKVVEIPAEPPVIQEEFGADDLWDRRMQFRARTYFIANHLGVYVDMGHGDIGWERIYPMGFEGVPVDGYYTITVKAEGVGRSNRYDPALFNVDFEEPIKLEVFANDATVESARNQNPTNREIALIDLDDHVAREYKITAWLDKGFNFGFRYANGPISHKRTVLKVQEKYHPETMTTNYRDAFAEEPSEQLESWLSDAYEGPRVRIYSTAIEGPDTRVWPPQNYRDLLATEKHGEVPEDPYVLIADFARDAFRRPVLPAEIELYNSFYEKERGEGVSPLVALTDTFKAILCSPHFLYIEAPVDESFSSESMGHRQKEAYRIASRLSYFLWGTMPDKELLDAAASEALLEPIELRFQTLRMLRDPRAEAFVGDFTDGWLGLSKLGQVMPDPTKFSFFTTHELEESMREETRSFFRYILQENRQLEEFLVSGYSFVDRNLAKHYGIDHAELDDVHQKVTFPVDSHRGGLLGQAGVLTVTANGVDTSPVVRGVWILENILGTPPSPPPPDVPALEPDIRGATSIRDQLSMHREIVTCNECHRKMDPLGFALENFDAVGAFRTHYSDARGTPTIPVDATGKLPSGESFEDVRELRTILLDRRDFFVRCLTEKLLIYALGRELAFSDRPQINAIIDELERRQGGLQDLVELVATSEAFLGS